MARTVRDITMGLWALQLGSAGAEEVGEVVVEVVEVEVIAFRDVVESTKDQEKCEKLSIQKVFFLI